MSHGAIPIDARRRLHGLRDCRVIRGAAGDNGFGWLVRRCFASSRPRFDLASPSILCDYRITEEGDKFAALVLR